jgi:hypothetical protein
MRKKLACAVVLGLALTLLGAVSGRERTEAAPPGDSGPPLAHNVFFALKDNSPQAKAKLVDACKKYLTKHPGEVFFAAGTIAEELNRPVNDRDFDVALHIVFKDRASHDKYQEAERHKQFIAECKDNWKKVRVFDSLVGK